MIWNHVFSNESRKVISFLHFDSYLQKLVDLSMELEEKGREKYEKIHMYNFSLIRSCSHQARKTKRGPWYYRFIEELF